VISKRRERVIRLTTCQHYNFNLPIFSIDDAKNFINCDGNSNDIKRLDNMIQLQFQLQYYKSKDMILYILLI
jgi:hypothetical protein